MRQPAEARGGPAAATIATSMGSRSAGAHARAAARRMVSVLCGEDLLFVEDEGGAAADDETSLRLLLLGGACGWENGNNTPGLPPSGTTTKAIVSTFCVRVPVLSTHMTVMHAASSVAASAAMSTPCRASSCAPNTLDIVNRAGRALGMPLTNTMITSGSASTTGWWVAATTIKIDSETATASTERANATRATVEPI